jgi:hypothetical protein
MPINLARVSEYTSVDGMRVMASSLFPQYISDEVLNKVMEIQNSHDISYSKLKF